MFESIKLPFDEPEINIPEHKFQILLAHHPEYASIYDKYNADFIVSGHLHGGLVRLPGVGGVVSPRLRLPDCDAGLMELSGDSKIFISRGLGSHTIPLRFFNRVEVNFLTLKGKKMFSRGTIFVNQISLSRETHPRPNSSKGN